MKHFSDLFFNLNDAISHHALLKDSVDFAKSSSNKNDTLKFPNELQLRNGSAESGVENIMNWVFLLNFLILPGHMKPVIISAKIRQHNSLEERKQTIQKRLA